MHEEVCGIGHEGLGFILPAILASVGLLYSFALTLMFPTSRVLMPVIYLVAHIFILICWQQLRNRETLEVSS